MNWIFNGKKNITPYYITYCISKVHYIREYRHLSNILYIYTRIIIIIIIVYFLGPPPIGDSEGCHADKPDENISPSLPHYESIHICR